MGSRDPASVLAKARVLAKAPRLGADLTLARAQAERLDVPPARGLGRAKESRETALKTDSASIPLGRQIP